jgi:hypothetical protein
LKCPRSEHRTVTTWSKISHETITSNPTMALGRFNDRATRPIRCRSSLAETSLQGALGQCPNPVCHLRCPIIPPGGCPHPPHPSKIRPG